LAGLAGAHWASEPGFAVVQQQCMKCHGKASMPQAPGVAALREFSGRRIYEFLTSGLNDSHRTMTLSDDAKQHVAESLSGRLLGSEAAGDAQAMPNRCAANPPLGDPAATGGWNGWGGAPENSRFQPHPGLAADRVSKLKLKWAFGLPGAHAAYGQPTVVAGRVFVGSDAGYRAPPPGRQGGGPTSTGQGASRDERLYFGYEVQNYEIFDLPGRCAGHPVMGRCPHSGGIH
jgi:hypothetical protein